MRLTAYGGAGEIGGNKILVEAGSTKLFLDYGVSYTSKSLYFSTFLQPRRFNLLGDYIITGVLPPIPGIYRPDMLSNELAHLSSASPSIDGCIISHAHLDHCGHASFIRADIPLYMGEGTRILIAAREAAKQPSAENIFNRGRRNNVRDCITFRTGNELRIGDVKVEPIHVDHSVPAAYSFILETSEGALAYTGDFRLHGPLANMTLDFIRKCRDRHVENLIIEGTRILDGSRHSETAVREDLTRIIEASPGKLVAAVVGVLDFDRLKSLLQACLANDRTLVISLHHAHILRNLARGGLGMDVPKMEPDVLVTYQKRRGSGRYVESDYGGWMSEIVGDPSTPLLKDADISSSPGKYVMGLSRAEDIIGLADLKPPRDSIFILSTSEPHSEEQVLEMDKIENWVKLLGMHFHHIHASGHASGPEIIETIMEINPRRVIPIHTQHPEEFEKLLRMRDMGCEVLKPNPNNMIEL